MITPLHTKMLAAIAAEPTDEGKLTVVLHILRDDVVLPEFDKWKLDTGETSHDAAVSLGACGAVSNIFCHMMGVPTSEVEPK